MISLRTFDSSMAAKYEIDKVESAICFIRGQRVVLDSDLAAIYGTSTMRLNEQFKRNRKRFPNDFVFVLTPEEFTRLREMVAANAQLVAKLEKLERRLDSHDEAIVGLFAALKCLLEPPEPKKRCETEFHVWERSARYRIKRRF